MTQGQARTLKNAPIATIFFHIRTERDPKVVRSWQRRARAALAAIPGLTDAERHEIAAVWSRSDSHRIDSPALRKLLGDRSQDLDGCAPARRYTRAKFDAAGKPLRRRRRPGLPGMAALYADAANDCIDPPQLQLFAVPQARPGIGR